MSAQKTKKKSIFQSTAELAKLMRDDPTGIERDVYQAGENLVGIYSDTNYTTKRFKYLNEQKIDILNSAIEDVSSGVQALRSSTLGLVFKKKEIVSYISPHGTTPEEGTVIYSINWKNIAAFKNWRKTDEDPVTQDDINNSVYFLTVEISRLMK